MTPQDALAMLDGAVAHLSLSRVDHARLVMAVEVLRTAVTRPASQLTCPAPEAHQAQ